MASAVAKKGVDIEITARAAAQMVEEWRMVDRYYQTVCIRGPSRRIEGYLDVCPRRCAFDN
jgi:hypothetical protein